MSASAPRTLAQHLADYRTLPFGRRVRVGLLAAFVVYHLAATLAWGAGAKMRAATEPLFWGYGALLKAAQSWGMFASIDEEQNLYVLGRLASGGDRRLAPPESDFSLEGRVARRERKYLSHLAKPAVQGEYGRAFLEAFCAEDAELRRIELWRQGGRPSELLPPERLVTVRCPSARGASDRRMP